MRKSLFLLSAFVLLVFCSCSEQSPKPVQPASDRQIKESLERANRYLVNDEEEDIDNYVRRHQLDMVATGTGLRYQIVEKGKDELIREGQTVTMDYVLYDLLGDVVYSSDSEGPMRMVVGHSDKVTGLDEAMRCLHEGDGVWVIIPSHLGYGLLGDQNAVPSRATLIYYLKITKVE